MKTWADFQDDYLFDVAGCSLFLAERAIRHAAREFCEKSLAHRIVLDPVSTVSGISTYDYDPASSLEVVKVLSATLDGQDIDLLLQGVDANEYGLVGLSPVEFTLQPAPSAGQRVVVTAIVKPSNTASGIEDRLFASHAEAIAQGAKARLYALAEQPFSNMEQAGLNRALFDAAINTARTSAAKGYSRAPLRVAPSFM